MRSRVFFVFVVLSSLPGIAGAETPPPTSGVVTTRELGKVAKQVSSEITATVQAIEPTERRVTLKLPSGDLRNIIAGDEVRNFDQIKVGDLVAVRYSEGLVLQLIKGGGGVRARVESESGSRAAKGDAPGASAVREVVVVADVIAVDAARKTVTLRGPQRTVELPVADPEQLKNIAVGDQVEATFTESIAVSVQPASAAK